MFPAIVSYSARGIILQQAIAQFKQREKMIGHRNRLREDDDLPLWLAPATKKKSPFFNVAR